MEYQSGARMTDEENANCKQIMENPRRNSYSNENPFQTQTLSSLSSLTHFLKKPQAFSFLLSGLLLLTWLFLRLQPSSPSHGFLRTHEKWSQGNHLKANLVRFKPGFPSSITKDKRGWLLNPITLVLNSSVKGGAVSCASVHLGEIRLGGVRGNHKHYTYNETFVIWGGKTKFKLENHQIADKGYVEAVID